MDPEEGHSRQETTSAMVLPHQKLSSLGRTIVLALLGMALLHMFQFLIVWLIGGRLTLSLLVFIVVTLGACGLIVARMRWAPLLVALATAAISLSQSIESSALLHPAVNAAFFSTLTVLLAFALVEMVAGVAATIQNYRSGERRAPRWLLSGLSGLGGLVIGMIVVAVLIAANPQVGPTPTITNDLPTVHMAGSDFLTNVVLVPKGEKLLLVDDDGVEHLIQNGSWTQSGTPSQKAEPGAPAVHLDLKSGSTEIGPLTTAGVFHLSCTIHRGMNLTVVVE